MPPPTLQHLRRYAIARSLFKPTTRWSRSRAARAQELLAFIREHGTAHPRVVDRRFAHGKILNWFGGSTNATTRLLDAMHYRGLLRVARRDSGTRVYAPREADPEIAAGDEIPVS